MEDVLLESSQVYTSDPLDVYKLISKHNLSDISISHGLFGLWQESRSMSSVTETQHIPNQGMTSFSSLKCTF